MRAPHAHIDLQDEPESGRPAPPTNPGDAARRDTAEHPPPREGRTGVGAQAGNITADAQTPGHHAGRLLQQRRTAAPFPLTLPADRRASARP